MEIHVDGNRASTESWRRAALASLEELPELSREQKEYAAKFGMAGSKYARRIFAIELERKELAQRAAQAARLIVRLAVSRFPGLQVQAVWLKTLDGKYRFEVEFQGRRSPLLVNEDLIDEVLESGSESSVRQVERVLEFGLPDAWTGQVS